MKKKNQILWTCGISFLLLILIFTATSRMTKEKTYPVFLLKQDATAGCQMEEGMISTMMLPVSCILPNACVRSEDILGKFLLSNMKAGDMLTSHNLDVTCNGITYPDIGNGNVLYTIALKSENANGWWISKGNEAMVFLYENTEQEKEYEKISVQTNGYLPVVPVRIIERVKIIRIMDENGIETSVSGKQPGMICIEINKEEARLLFNAENGKRIKIVAKNPD